tara:strand:+ start:62 stop:556 length:495 start_codon:yes stop_codon:yes gene_type:complete
MPNYTKESLEAAIEFAILKQRITVPEIVDETKSRIIRGEFVLKNRKGKVLCKVPMEVVDEIKGKIKQKKQLEKADKSEINQSDGSIYRKSVKDNEVSIADSIISREQDLKIKELETFKKNQERKNAIDNIGTFISLLVAPIIALGNLIWLIILIVAIVAICMIF